MGRLVGVPHFFTEAAFMEERDDGTAMRRAKKMDDDGHSLKVTQVEAVRRMHMHFAGFLLRRTTDSLNWKGLTLLDLPRHEDIVGVLELTQRERDIIDQRAQAAKER
jgi:TATA-binding protein-associated factor